MYIYMYIYIYISLTLSLCLSVYQSIHPSICLSIYLSIQLSIYLSILLPPFFIHFIFRSGLYLHNCVGLSACHIFYFQFVFTVFASTLILHFTCSTTILSFLVIQLTVFLYSSFPPSLPSFLSGLFPVCLDGSGLCRLAI